MLPFFTISIALIQAFEFQKINKRQPIDKMGQCQPNQQLLKTGRLPPCIFWKGNGGISKAYPQSSGRHYKFTLGVHPADFMDGIL